MSSPATRIHVRHAGDEDSAVLADREARKVARRKELEERMASFEAENPELAARISKSVNRRRR